jgi:LuxR family transcriptional regulator of csgAB operon
MRYDDTHEYLLDKSSLKGIFYQDVNHNQLIKGINAIFEGDCWFSRKLMISYLKKRRERTNRFNGTSIKLTKKEMMILQYVAEGDTNEAIANQLCVSVHTIKTHIYNIFRKIGVSNRIQAINWMVGNGSEWVENSVSSVITKNSQSSN